MSSRFDNSGVSCMQMNVMTTNKFNPVPDNKVVPVVIFQLLPRYKSMPRNRKIISGTLKAVSIMSLPVCSSSSGAEMNANRQII